MFAAFTASLSPLACALSKDDAAEPKLATADASVAIAARDDANEIPCEPRRVLVEICQQCHARPTKRGAPFALERRSDVFAKYMGAEVRELMQEEVGAGRMPLAPVTMSDAYRETLLAWLRAGAPAVAPTDCHADAATDDATSDAADDGVATTTDAGVDDADAEEAQ